ncbi:MAG: pantoate--beta-alanine ligase [Alphaproteobacteria bacterium]|nr:pantoate--beta-alanine ligase [Alphaproteobacteria bacterium]
MSLRTKSVEKKISEPQVIRAIAPLRAWVSRARGKAETVALVPTMGALHKGHLALVRLAHRRADRVVVSIFVNPAQFAPNEDFSNYPRTWDADVAALSQLSVDAIWAPSAATMYPDGFSTMIVPGGPALAGLEDKFRPHFFGGVCTVVTKLLLQVRPDFATFGEKDYQQLKVVTAMARDLDVPTRIIGLPTVREKDGLAMSSRNAYLSANERGVAPTLYHALKECAVQLKAGRPIAAMLAQTEAQIERAGFAVDYLEARHAETLAPIATLANGPVRLLVAAKLGRTRLIDNIGV